MSSNNLIGAKEETALNKKVGDKHTIYPSAISVARLFVAIGSEWKYTGISGYLVFLFDRETKIQFIRIYNINNLDNMRFQAEVPFEPVYTIESEHFHTLELENVTIGFMHAIGRTEPLPDDKNATLTSISRRFANAITSNGKTENDLKEAKAAKGSNGNLEGKRRGSTFQKIASGAVAGVKQKLGLQSSKGDKTIGTPQNFVHNYHVGINPDGTLDLERVPPEWKIILKENNITKNMMKNPEVNKQVVKVMTSMMGMMTGGGSTIPTDIQKSSDNNNKPGKGRQVRVKFDFASAGDLQLSVFTGEILTIIKDFQDGWSKARKTDGTVGMVPTNYLEDLAPSPILPVKSVDSPPVQEMKRLPPVNASNASIESENVSPPAPTTAKRPPPKPSNVTKASSPSTPSSEESSSVLSQSRAPPPRPAPARPNQTTRPPPIRSPPKVQEPPPVVVEEIIEVEQHADDEEERDEEVAPAVVPPPRSPMKNPLLASIESFKMEDLSKSEEVVSPNRSGNPLLSGIESFKKDNLKKAEVEAPPTKAPSVLDAIKKGGIELKKVKPEVPPMRHEPEPPIAAGIAGLLQARLAQIRQGVKDEDNEESDGSDWGDD